MKAFIRRSDYKNTWGSFEERRMGNFCDMSVNAAPSEDWCRRWNELIEERRRNSQKIDFTYQTIGGINPVATGDTPMGVPGGHFEFLPK